MANETKSTIQGRVLRALSVLFGAVFLLSSISLFTMYQAQSSYKGTREALKQNRGKFIRLDAALERLGALAELHVIGKPLAPSESEFLLRVRGEFAQALDELGGVAAMSSFSNELVEIKKQFEATSEHSSNKDFADLRQLVDTVEAKITNSHESALAESLLNLIYLIIAAAIATLIIPAGSLWLITEKINKELLGYVQSLDEFSGGNQMASEELEAASLELASASNQQAAAVQQTVASITEIRSMLSETESHIIEVRDLTATMNEKTQDGAKIMAQVELAMHAIEQTNAQLESFKEMIQSIRGKTRVINDIVFKTQLLSFNASIEAARAGQYGRGFSVVAEEVGKLAQISGEASKEIDSLLSHSEERVVKIVEEVQDRVSDGKSVSQEAMKRFGEIAREIATISEKVTRVGDASVEQAGGIEQTARAMDQMNETTHKNKQSADQLNNIGQRVHSFSHEIRGVSASIRRFVRESVNTDIQLSTSDLETSDREASDSETLDVEDLASQEAAAEKYRVPVVTRRADDAAILSLVNKIARKHIEPNPSTKTKKRSMGDISPDDGSFRKSGHK